MLNIRDIRTPDLSAVQEAEQDPVTFARLLLGQNPWRSLKRHWCLREYLERGAIKGLTVEEMQAQLAGIRYRHTSSGRVEIESKDDAKKRGQQSPDRAEALVLAFARALPRQQTVAYSVPRHHQPILAVGCGLASLRYRRLA